MAKQFGYTYPDNHKQVVMMEDDVYNALLPFEPLQPSLMISGVAATGAVNSLTDITKEFEVDILSGKLIKFSIGALEYIRTILANTPTQITFTTLFEGAYSVAVVGDIAQGQVTITPSTKENLDHYTVEFVSGEGNNVPLSAAFLGTMLTVTLATDGTGALDPAANTGMAVAAVIDAMPLFSATMTGAGGAMGETLEPIPFEGGQDPITVPPLTPYEILSITPVNGEQKVQNVDVDGVAANNLYRTFELTLTRPADTTVYSAGDVIGDVSQALMEFVDVAKAAGYGVNITNVRLQTNDTGLAGKEIRLHFYTDSVAPIADNAAFSLSDLNASKRRGVLTVTFGTGDLSKVAQDMFTNLIMNPVTRDIYVIPQTTQGFTPSANSTWIIIQIAAILSN